MKKEKIAQKGRNNHYPGKNLLAPEFIYVVYPGKYGKEGEETDLRSLLPPEDDFAWFFNKKQ